MKVEGGGIRHFTVKGIELPPGADASFAVWALLPTAMEGGFNLQVSRPINPVVAANAKALTRIWEMWVPSWYRSISVSGTGEWSRIRKGRLPLADL